MVFLFKNGKKCVSLQCNYNITYYEESCYNRLFIRIVDGRVGC